MTCGIYAIINTENHKCYYGSSVDMEARLHEHFIRLKRGRHENSRLQNAYNAAEDKNIFVSVHFLISEEKNLIRDEQLCFDVLKPAYNINLIAGRPPKMAGPENYMFGKTHNDTIRKIISDIQTTRERPPEHYDVQRNIFKGEGNPFYGKEHSPETLEKLSGNNHYTKKPGYVHFSKKSDYIPPSKRPEYTPKTTVHTKDTIEKVSGDNHYTKREGFIPPFKREGYIRPSEKPDYDPTPRLRSKELRDAVSGDNHYSKKPGYVHFSKKPGYVPPTKRPGYVKKSRKVGLK